MYMNHVVKHGREKFDARYRLTKRIPCFILLSPKIINELLHGRSFHVEISDELGTGESLRSLVLFHQAAKTKEISTKSCYMSLCW